MKLIDAIYYNWLRLDRVFPSATVVAVVKVVAGALRLDRVFPSATVYKVALLLFARCGWTAFSRVLQYADRRGR